MRCHRPGYRRPDQAVVPVRPRLRGRGARPSTSRPRSAGGHPPLPSSAHAPCTASLTPAIHAARTSWPAAHPRPATSTASCTPGPIRKSMTSSATGTAQKTRRSVTCRAWTARSREPSCRERGSSSERRPLGVVGGHRLPRELGPTRYGPGHRLRRRRRADRVDPQLLSRRSRQPRAADRSDRRDADRPPRTSRLPARPPAAGRRRRDHRGSHRGVASHQPSSAPP